MKNNLRTKFLKDGYFNIKNFLTTKEKKIIINLIYDSFKKFLKLPKIDNFSLESEKFHSQLIKLRNSNPKIFGEIYDKINLNSSLRGVFYQEKFKTKFAKLLNVKSNQIYLFGFMMRFDVPGDTRNKLDWHQDSPYYMMSYPKFNAGVCWAAITKNSDYNGTLKFIKKSNSKFFKIKSFKKAKGLKSVKYHFSLKKNELNNTLSLKQNFGDVAFMHMNLKHKSGDNISKKIRITIGCRFIDMSKSFNVGKEIYRYGELSRKNNDNYFSKFLKIHQG